VLEDDLLGARVTNTLDHGSVVASVAEDDTTWQLGSKGGEGGVVRDVTRREDESSRLAMQRSQFVFETEVESTVSGNVTSTTRTSAVSVEGTLHSVEDDAVSRHAKVVV
jgi:hypothetical protein